MTTVVAKILQFPAVQLTRLFRRPQANLTDGRAELDAAYQIHEILLPLPETSQLRCLQHVAEIFTERKEQRSDFEQRLLEANGARYKFEDG